MNNDKAAQYKRPYDNELGYKFSLDLLAGCEIVDVRGWLTNEFGDVTFKLVDIVVKLPDGTLSKLRVEGEHDFPYIADYSNILDEDLMRSLHDDEEG